MGVSKNNGTPKSSILIGFSTINHPFWGYPYFWKDPNTSVPRCPQDIRIFVQAPAPLPLHRNFIQFNGCARAKWPTARSYFEMILKAARRRSVPCLKNPGDVIYSTKFGATWRYSSAHTWNRKLHCKTRPGSNICKSILRFECMYECQGMATGNCCQRKRSPPVLVQILKITSTDLH